MFLRLKRKIANHLRTLNTPANMRGVADYWTKVNVTAHHQFSNIKDSLEYFYWRSEQYFSYLDLMPVSGYDDKVVLDYGCGPGHDLVGFGLFSKPSKLIGADLSRSSLAEARHRLGLHGIGCEIVQIDPAVDRLPFDDNSIDHIHSSGVLHHTPDPVAVMKEFARILKPSGTVNIMVYNYDSIFLHLHIAYELTIIQNQFPGLSIKERFAKNTDGDNCPISNCYRPGEWIELCVKAGFDATFSGAAISMFEASIAPKRYDAILDRRLPRESRLFLLDLRFNEAGYPMYNGAYAGVDACFHLTHKGFCADAIGASE